MNGLESMYEFVCQVYFLGTLAASSYCYYKLAKAFLQKKRRVWLVGATYFSVMAFLYYIPLLFHNLLAYSLGALSGLLSMYLLDHKNLQQKIFLAATFFSLRWMAFASEITLSRLASLYITPLLSIAERPWAQLGAFALQSLLDACLSFALMFCAIWAIQKVYVHKREGMTVGELMLMLIPSLSSTAGHAVLQVYQEVYLQDTQRNIEDAFGRYHWLSLLYYLISFLAILGVIVLFQSLKNRQEEEERNRLLLGQVQEIQRHISGIERLYGDIRTLRHDMNSHILTLEQLHIQEKHQAASAYLEELKTQLNDILPEIRSGNPVTDVILTEWLQRAREKGVSFSCAFCYPQESVINAFDVSVILNNALSNALAGALGSESPDIRLRSRRHSNAYLIEISNSFSGEIIWNEESGLPESTQAGPGHGLGLSSIQRVARKYFGDISISLDGGRFTLSVLLMAA